MTPGGIALLIFGAIMAILMLSQLDAVAKHFRRKKPPE